MIRLCPYGKQQEAGASRPHSIVSMAQSGNIWIFRQSLYAEAKLAIRVQKMVTLIVNGKETTVDVEAETPLLWVLRDTLGLTGTKFGCGIAACGACTVHVDGEATRSCVTPIDSVDGAEIKTIEGLKGGDQLHKVQQAWIDNQVPQCGYCQSGMIMAVVALLEEIPEPTDEDINDYITNICRCGTYQRIRKAIHAAAKA